MSLIFHSCSGPPSSVTMGKRVAGINSRITFCVLGGPKILWVKVLSPKKNWDC